jgi:putative tricarboxylic transport membrane protein
MTTPDSSASPQPSATWPQTLVGAGVLLTGLALAFGAIGISSEAGYGGVGPNFLPWLVSVVLVLCGAWILWEARTGGFRELDAPTGAEHAYWPGFVWVSAGLLLNAALITTCSRCRACAARAGRAASTRRAPGSSTSSPAR